jgi:hypothetical protein
VKEIGADLKRLVPVYLKIIAALQLNYRPENALILNLYYNPPEQIGLYSIQL